jgi:Flp pilus assembly protein TadG
MPTTRRAPARSGTTLVEAAIVLPVAFLLILGSIVVGLGVFRYVEVASLAREGARWASVHGSNYQQETGTTAATAQEVYNKAILPNVVSMDTSKLSYSVTWNPDNVPPDATVSVTVSYQWFPEVYLVGPITVSSKSTMAMSY